MAKAMSMAQIAGAARDAGWPTLLIPVVVAIAMAESAGVPGAHNPDASTGDNSYGLMQINMLGGMGPQRRAEFGLKDNSELWDPVVNMKAALRLYKDAGNSFIPWSTWKHGTHAQFLPEARKAAGAPADPPRGVQNPGDGTSGGSGGPGAQNAAFGLPKVPGIPDWLQALGDVAGGLASGNLGGLALGAAGAVQDDPDAAGPVATSVGIVAALGGFLEMTVRASLWVGNPENWLRTAKVATGGALIVAGAAAIARPVTQPAVDTARKAAKVIKP